MKIYRVRKKGTTKWYRVMAKSRNDAVLKYHIGQEKKKMPDAVPPKKVAPKGIMTKELHYRPPAYRTMSDSDKDGYPRPIDCEPHNPNKQGFISWLQAKREGKTHDEVEQERYANKSERMERRHAYKLQKLQYAAEEAEARRPIVKAKEERAKAILDLDEKRTAIAARKSDIMVKRQKSMGSMPSLMGTAPVAKGGALPSLMMPAPGSGIPSAPKPRKRSRRRKKK